MQKKGAVSLGLEIIILIVIALALLIVILYLINSGIIHPIGSLPNVSKNISIP